MMKRKGFSCRQCGNCCLNLVDAYRGCVSDADLELWRREGREDLLSWVETLDLGHGNFLHLAWLDPETGEEVDRCPWLQESAPGGYLCAINDVKPQYCRDYPEHRKHGETSGCPGFNPRSGQKK
jgi:Fe-S-cluster containining protein